MFNKKYNPLTGKRNSTRRSFKRSTKKKEWNLAVGRREDNFKTTSQCRECSLRVVWGNKAYEFDHKDNNNGNNGQRNCYLVCRNCHGKATKLKKIKQYDRLSGWRNGYKTIKLKASYKKQTRRKPGKKTKRRQTDIFELQPLKMPKFRF